MTQADDKPAPLLPPEKEARLTEVLDAIQQRVANGKCEICGEQAGGIGDGHLYCSAHFWEKLDEGPIDDGK